MKIETWKHENVNPDGTFDDPEKGAVRTQRGVFRFFPGYCLYCEGRNDNGTVRGITLHPESKKEWDSLSKNWYDPDKNEVLKTAKEHGLETGNFNIAE